MSASEKAQHSGSVASIGGFRKRASSVISNAALYQLVEDMAGNLDEVNGKLDLILDLLRNKLAG